MSTNNGNRFSPPNSNYFRVPNEWINTYRGISNLAEFKIVMYVMRHTWGFQEYGMKKRISIDEFMYGRKYADGSRMDEGTGLSKQSVVDGIKRAVADGILEEETDDTDKARKRKSYSLNMSKFWPSGTQNLDQESRPQMSKPWTAPVDKLDTNGLNYRHRSEKETSRKTLEKEREKAFDSFDRSEEETSLSPPSSNTFFLTEEQTIFWNRWCAMTKCDPKDLNQTAYKHVVYLADKILTTDDLASLYEFTYTHIRELPRSTGKDPTPPRLGNLINVYQEWEQARVLKSRDQQPVRKTTILTPEQLKAMPIGDKWR
jgi:DNA-binding PadR family transcriptional regulator